MDDAYKADLRVSAADFIRNFATLIGRAPIEPITITKSGRDYLVVLSADEYQRLKRLKRQAYRTKSLPDDLAKAIAAVEPTPESFAFDHETSGKDR